MRGLWLWLWAGDTPRGQRGAAAAPFRRVEANDANRVLGLEAEADHGLGGHLHVLWWWWVGSIRTRGERGAAGPSCDSGERENRARELESAREQEPAFGHVGFRCCHCHASHLVVLRVRPLLPGAVALDGQRLALRELLRGTQSRIAREREKGTRKGRTERVRSDRIWRRRQRRHSKDPLPILPPPALLLTSTMLRKRAITVVGSADASPLSVRLMGI